MKLAISAMGAGLDAPVDLRVGRARGFVVVDTHTGNFRYLDNGGEDRVRQSAGPQTAGMLAAHATSAVLTGRCGPNAFQALQAAGIRVYTGLSGGTVREALSRFLDGEFQEASAAEVLRSQ